MFKQLITGLMITGMSCSLALADSNHNYGKGKHHNKGRFDHARVLNVDPITETLTHRVPTETCWTERVRYESRGDHSYTPSIIGGILGAAVGNSLGHKRHKTNRAIKAVALGALGASIGNEISRNHNRSSAVTYRNEERCEVTYDTSYEEQIVGYDVTYRYRGETYHTKMDYDPGNKIRVRVNVRPVM